MAIGLTMLYRMKENRWYWLSASGGVPILKWREPQDQIARYIFQEGVDIGVATNGRKWDFYFAYKTHVPWRNRRFCAIELENPQEAIANFQKYLSKSKVIDGSAKAAAENIVAERIGIQWDPKPPSSEKTEDLRREEA